MVSLKTIIENEWFIVCDLLPSDRFITFCRNRGINTSREQLEQLDRLDRHADWRATQQGEFLRGPGKGPCASEYSGSAC